MNEKMKKYLKITLIAIGSILFIKFAIIAVQTILFVYPPAISKDKMEREFIDNRDMIVEVVHFLEEQKYEYIRIYTNDEQGEMYVRNYGEKGSYVSIENQHISEVIGLLIAEYNFRIIRKEEDGIYFQRWASLDYGRGIVYSLDQDITNKESFTIIEPLQEDNWYFYEDE